jgi:3-oxoacyl-[acyl-carrier protein] reductase
MVDADGEALAEAASYAGGTPAVADVADTGQVEGVVADAMTRTGRVDIVVNNAGILRDAMLWKLDDAQWDAVLAVHAGGTFRLTRAAVPQMRAAGRGRIINVTSYTGLRGNPGQVNYATAKAGIIGFTKTAAKELARFGITVNAISPNAETRMIESIPGDTRAQLTAGIPLGRFADPAEIGPAVAFPRLGRGGLHHRHSPAGRRRPVHLAFVAPS